MSSDTLHMAVRRRSKELFNELLRKGADPNLANEFEDTPLHIICRQKNGIVFAEMLFKICQQSNRSVQVNVKNRSGKAPLHLAVSRKCLSMVALLLRNGADPNITNADGLTPLHLICYGERDHYNLAKMLFELSHQRYRPVEVNFHNESIDPLLHGALYKRHRNLVQLLLKNGADPNLENFEGLTPLRMFCEQTTYDHELAKIFFDINSSNQLLEIDAQDDYGNTALHWALQNNLKSFIELLLINGADPNVANKKGITPFFMICKKIKQNLVDVGFFGLIFNGSINIHQKMEVDVQDKFGQILPSLAPKKKIKKIDLNSTNADGSTLLHVFCKYHHQLAEILFKIGDAHRQTIDVNARDKFGNTPLHLALDFADPDYMHAVELLLRRGANPNSANADGLTPLHIICLKKNHGDDVFMELFFKVNNDLQQTIEIDAQDNLGRTPLQSAVANLRPDMVNILLDHGAKLSNFVFPHESYFGLGYDTLESKFSMQIVSGALAVVEILLNNEYEFKPSEALIIMELFGKCGLLYESASQLNRFRRGVGNLTKIAKTITINSKVSLHGLIQSELESDKQLATYTDLFKFWSCPNERWAAYAHHLCEIMSRRFFRHWAEESVSELKSCYQLPMEFDLQTINNSSMNKHLYEVCFVATNLVSMKNRNKRKATNEAESVRANKVLKS